MSPGGIVALCASAVTILGGLVHMVRMAYRLVRTLTVTVEAVGKLTHVISEHLQKHPSAAGVSREEFAELAEQVTALQEAMRDLQTMFRPSLHRHPPAPRLPVDIPEERVTGELD